MKVFLQDLQVDHGIQQMLVVTTIAKDMVREQKGKQRTYTLKAKVHMP